MLGSIPATEGCWPDRLLPIAEPASLPAVAVNGEPVTLTGADNYRQAFSFADNVSVTVDKFRETYGEAVQARSQLYDLIIYSTPCGWDSEVNQTVSLPLHCFLFRPLTTGPAA